ncbi:MAG: LysR substrate-binding domain-containing protein [Paracoccaceae bacterium]|nr:LysR substrate-binding domain-containing protein [Paracoccaceae bacterium]
MSHLSSDLLRTFLAIDEAGSVTGGAERIGRSQSATSLQIRQLEEIVGKPLFERHGRGVVLTRAGETLKPAARKVVQSLDRTLAELRGEGLTGRLRIGMPDDHGRVALAKIVSDFAAMHPSVELDVQCALGNGFESALASGALDLAVFEVPLPGPSQEVLREDALVWCGAADRSFDADGTLPVALFDRTCWWRDLALASLDEAGRAYRVVFTSESAVGVRAAVRSGIAAGLLSTLDDRTGLTGIRGLNERFSTYLVLERAPGSTGPACDAMCDAIRRAFAR